MNNLWEIINESRKIILHPKLAELVNQEHDIKLLDYGCGDGSLIKLLNNDIEVSIFDINRDVLFVAKENLIEYKPIIHFDSNSIPRNHYDYIILSLVLMEMGNKNDIAMELGEIWSMLNKNGRILVAITHPCFRQYIFSTFRTSYSEDQNFNYFNEGDKFKVHVKDSANDNSALFYDYHWMLSSTISFIINAGFKLTAIFELQDISHNNGYSNINCSPYIILKAIKE